MSSKNQRPQYRRQWEPRLLDGLRTALGERALDAVPYQDLSAESGDFEWHGLTSAACFELIPPDGKYPERWVDLDFEIRAEPGVPVSPLIQIDRGHGYSVGARIPLPAPHLDRVTALVRFPQPVRGLRFSPLDRPGRFSLGPVRIRQVSSPEAAIRLGLPRAKALAREPTQLPRTLKNVYSLWRTEGLLGLKRRLAGETGSQFNANDQAYAEWIDRYDKLSDLDRKAIKARLEILEHQPTISIVLPLRDSSEATLKRTIELVQGQIYSHWQLCIAGDLSNKLELGNLINQYRSEDNRIDVVFDSGNSQVSICMQRGFELARGELILLLEETDRLREHALYMIVEELNADPDAALIYADEDSINSAGERSNPRFKPDWNPDLFFAHDYISHFVAIGTDLLKRVGGFRRGADGIGKLDLLLRATAAAGPRRIRHIPYVLGHTASIVAPTDSGTAVVSAETIVGQQLQGADPRIRVEQGLLPGTCHVRYPIPDPAPLVSLLIPTRDGLPFLQRCIESITERTQYPRYEIVVVDNQSESTALLRYLRALSESGRARIVRYDHAFNFSAINNLAAREAGGEILCLLNDDVEVISLGWLEEMVGHAVRPEVGAVGAKLYYPDGRLQHVGVVFGIYGSVAHIHRGLSGEEGGYCGRAQLTQNVSAVTAACLVVRRDLFEQVCGFDEDLPMAFNDIDFCLRLEELGHRNVFTPHAKLCHQESASRGLDDSPAKLRRLSEDLRIMERRWGARLRADPYYSPNLSVDAVDCSLAFPPRTQRPWLPSLFRNNP